MIQEIPLLGNFQLGEKQDIKEIYAPHVHCSINSQQQKWKQPNVSINRSGTEYYSTREKKHLAIWYNMDKP